VRSHRQHCQIDGHAPPTTDGENTDGLGLAPGAHKRRDLIDTSAAPPRTTVRDLVAELTELTRRQMILLHALATAEPGR
jgi:hypothetical protein